MTRSFSLIRDDVQLIEAVRAEENLLSDSAALRRLIRDGMKYRNLRKEAELEIAKQIHSTYQSQAPSRPNSKSPAEISKSPAEIPSRKTSTSARMEEAQ